MKHGIDVDDFVIRVYIPSNLPFVSYRSFWLIVMFKGLALLRLMF